MKTFYPCLLNCLKSYSKAQFVKDVISGIIVAIIAAFTYYTSVAKDQPFKSRFLEMSIISISVAVLSFVVGLLAKAFLGVDV